MKLLKLREHNHGNVQMIIMAVVAGVVLAVAIPIIFSVLGGISYQTIDTNLGGTYNATSGDWSGPRPATNASSSLASNVGTFFTISPIYLVVLAAVGIISAVMMIMVTRRR